MIAEAPIDLVTYRVFWTNKAGRIVGVAETIAARDDAAAVREAERIAGGRTVEVWDRARRVAMLNGAGAKA